jgi:hypothetical protein
LLVIFHGGKSPAVKGLQIVSPASCLACCNVTASSDTVMFCFMGFALVQITILGSLHVIYVIRNVEVKNSAEDCPPPSHVVSLTRCRLLDRLESAHEGAVSPASQVHSSGSYFDRSFSS